MMDKEAVRKYLTEDEEGQTLLEELKKPLLDKRNELLAENREFSERVKLAEQRAAKAEQEVERRDEGAKKSTLDKAFENVYQKHNVLPDLTAIFRTWITSKNEFRVDKDADGELRPVVIPAEGEEPVPFEEFFDRYFDLERAEREGDFEPHRFMAANGHYADGEFVDSSGVSRPTYESELKRHMGV